MTTALDVQEKSKQKATLIKNILKSPQGEELMNFLKEEFSSTTSFVSGDPYYTSFKEGQRSVVLFLMDLEESNYEIHEPE